MNRRILAALTVFALAVLNCTAANAATYSSLTSKLKNNLEITGTLTVDGTSTFTGTPTFTAPPIVTGVILKGTSFNGTLQVLAGLGQATTFTLPDAGSASDTVATLKAANIFTGIDSFAQNGVKILGSATFYGTLSTGALGQATTYIFPDPGNAADAIVDTKTAQAITGVKTFADLAAVNTMGTGPAPYNASGVLNMQVNSFSTAAGTGAQTGHTYTLPASALIDTGRGVRIKAWGHTAANANNKTVTVNFGAATFTTGAIAANAKDYYIDVTVVRTGASAQTWVTDGYVNGAPISFATYSSQTGTLTQTETGTLTVSTTLTDGTNSAGDIVESGFEVDAL